MSGPHVPPPEVPEEFAEAYRAAYQRALEEQPGAASPVGSHRAGPDSATGFRSGRGSARARWAVALQRARRSRWFVPVLVGVVVVLLLVASFAVGRLAANAGDGGAARPARAVWHGRVRAVVPEHARASCTARPGVDAAGHRVTYGVAHVLDHDPATAWRCAGDARGVRLTFRLARRTAIGRVGLVPGYAKTDGSSHVDRYAQDNRVTRVRWTIGTRQVTQRLDGDPHDRSIRLLRVPRTSARAVSLEILDAARGPRDVTAVSSVELDAAVGVE